MIRHEPGGCKKGSYHEPPCDPLEPFELLIGGDEPGLQNILAFEDQVIKLRTALQSIAQYDPRWKGQKVNNAPSRQDLIAKAFDALEDM